MRKLLASKGEAVEGLVDLAREDGKLALVHVGQAHGATLVQGRVDALRHLRDALKTVGREVEKDCGNRSGAQQAGKRRDRARLTPGKAG